MVYRVAFVGEEEWLTSARLNAVLRDGRIASITRSPVDGFHFDRLRARPDISVLQLGRNPEPALELLRELGASSPDLRCIVAADDVTEGLLKRLVEYGSWGHVPETSDHQVYSEAIRNVGAGRLSYPADVLDRIRTCRGSMFLSPPETQSLDQLSADERRMLEEIANGRTTAEAAATLGVSTKIALRIRSAMMKRLGIHDRVLLVRFAVRSGLIDP